MDDGNHTPRPNDSETPVHPESGLYGLHKSSRSASPSAQDYSNDEPLPSETKETTTVALTDSAARVEEESLPEANKNLVDAVTDKIRGESMSLPPDSPSKNHQSFAPKSSNSNSGSDGDSSDKEQSRKRKLSSRSSIANEVAVRLHSKRPKESDVPEREEDSDDTLPAISAQTDVPKSSQVFGFGSFASAKSPFATGQENVSDASPNTSSGVSSRSVPDVETSKTSIPEGPSPSVALVNTQSALSSVQSSGGGFAAFASTTPFKRSSVVLPSPSINSSEQRDSLAGPVRRSKSPVGKHQAFGQYSTGVSRFGNLSSRKGLQDDIPGQQPVDIPSGPGEPVEFDNILKAKGEEVANQSIAKPEILEIAHNTGEEEDLTVFQTRAKLYTQDETFAYKERGTGLLKLNVRRSDGEGARIVMRAEGVLRLLLNMSLYPGLICELGPDPKFIKIAEISTHERRLHAIKVGNAKLAQELYDNLIENTPSGKRVPSSEPAV